MGEYEEKRQTDPEAPFSREAKLKLSPEKTWLLIFTIIFFGHLYYCASGLLQECRKCDVFNYPIETKFVEFFAIVLYINLEQPRVAIRTIIYAALVFFSYTISQAAFMVILLPIALISHFFPSGYVANGLNSWGWVLVSPIFRIFVTCLIVCVSLPEIRKWSIQRMKGIINKLRNPQGLIQSH